jgi:ubiquinone/menaquinone biosynthesis C-methylase UbiE
MNGLHVFPDKQHAIAQINRVTRPGGKLVACGYVKGVKRLADWFVKRFGVRNGYFNPPFFTLDDVADQFKGFTITRRGNTKSVVYFEAIKTQTPLQTDMPEK